MTLYKDKHSYNFTTTSTITLGEYVSEKVRRAPDYNDGELESLKAKVTELTELVALLYTHMPALKKRLLAEEFNLEKVDD